jgi:glycine dehydrogenase subunit 1
MSYVSLSDKDRKEMLATIGVSSTDDLFCCIPESVRLKRALDLPPAESEQALVRHFAALSGQNSYSEYLSFLGGGAYDHFIPSIVDSLASRSEFVTPYTPYQPEVSQGTLQAIFEYQTLICQLTGMDIANASLYDGATGAAEAVLMALRLKNKPRVLVASTVHPQYRHVIRTYIKNLGIQAEEVPYTASGALDIKALAAKMGPDTGAVILQSPNYFGVCEDIKAVADLAHGHQSLLAVVVAEALSLGLLEAPGKLGADIVTGEAQSFGMPLSFGGPYLGFMATMKDFVRQMPGRVAGQTVDVDGTRGFVLTMSTREQHIRREKATSNICSNQGLCALRATIFLEAMGKEGLREAAWLNVQKTAYAIDTLTAIPGIRRKFSGSHFNEFVLELSKPWSVVDEALRKKKILAGIGLDEAYPGMKNDVLVCVTEQHGKDDIDSLARSLEEVLR